MDILPGSLTLSCNLKTFSSNSLGCNNIKNCVTGDDPHNTFGKGTHVFDHNIQGPNLSMGDVVLCRCGKVLMAISVMD